MCVTALKDVLEDRYLVVMKGDEVVSPDKKINFGDNNLFLLFIIERKEEDKKDIVWIAVYFGNMPACEAIFKVEFMEAKVTFQLLHDLWG